MDDLMKLVLRRDRQLERSVQVDDRLTVTEKVKAEAKRRIVSVTRTLFDLTCKADLNFMFVLKDGEYLRAVATSYFIGLLDEERKDSRLAETISDQFRVSSGVMESLVKSFESHDDEGWDEFKHPNLTMKINRLKETLHELRVALGVEYCLIYEHAGKHRTMRAFCSSWLAPFLQEDDVIRVTNEQEASKTWDKFLVVSGDRRKLFER